MFWTGFFVGFAACLAIGLTAHLVHDRRQRAAFIASLSPAERERFRGFEKVRGDWHEFRELSCNAGLRHQDRSGPSSS